MCINSGCFISLLDFLNLKHKYRFIMVMGIINILDLYDINSLKPGVPFMGHRQTA